MAKTEYDYTTKMIKSNLSNFSAWHHRSKVIVRMLKEEAACDDLRKQVLDEGRLVATSVDMVVNMNAELNLIHDALFDPYDQSLWFYHQNLMCNLSPESSDMTIAPNLTKNEKLSYLQAEKEFISELLEDAKDCKWVYQSLIDCNIREGEIVNELSSDAKTELDTWLTKLQVLDPLRTGRWLDLRTKLQLG